MGDIPNRGNRDSAARMRKTNSFSGKGIGAPDQMLPTQNNPSPVQNTDGCGQTSNISTNHHPIMHVQHHQNHRSFVPRGRYRGDGGFYGGHTHFSGHHPGSNLRTPPPAAGPPSSKTLFDFMMKEWRQFAIDCKSGRCHDPCDIVSTMHPGHQHHQQQSMVPTSPRMGGHINSPHRGQHFRYNQNSTGSNWSVNSGGSGRKFSENGEYPNTGSLRRHHNHRGSGHITSLQNNHSWQRGTLTNRQNSPNNAINRPAGTRHHYQSRPIASPTPPPASSMTAIATSATASSTNEVIGKLSEEAVVLNAEVHSPVEPSDSAKPTSAVVDSATTKRKNIESPTEPISTPATPDIEAKKAVPAAGDEGASSSSSTSSLTISKVKQQQQMPAIQQHHPTRRRAATTQSSSCVSAPSTNLLLSSSLPATRASETASVTSSSFCSLVDQVDALSAADQYFTPEPPSSPSSPSASLSVTVADAFKHSSAGKVTSAESPSLSSPPPLSPPLVRVPASGVNTNDTTDR